MAEAERQVEVGGTSGAVLVVGGYALGTRPVAAVAMLVIVVLAAAVYWLSAEGTLSVDSFPPGATVRLDGKEVGETPVTLRTRVATTGGVLEIALAGYLPWRQEVSFGPRDNESLLATLQPQFSIVEVVSSPSGATVFWDGTKKGNTPLKIEGVAAGPHRLRLTMNHFRDWEGAVEVASGDHPTFSVRLEGLLAELVVNSTPEGAAVTIGGVERGVTPLTIADLPAGNHEVRISKVGFQEWVGTVALTPDNKATIEAHLSRAIAAVGDLQRPLAAVIDNHPNARPQSGLPSADVVIEALAEGGITRFLAFFATRPAEVIGPIRSARHYFVHWADEFDAILVLCGASPQGHDAIAATGIATLNEQAGSYGFWRGSSREAPHNLYTSWDGLRAEAARRGYREDLGSLSGLRFHEQPAPPRGEAADTLTVHYPFGYRVTWDYVAATNDYLRYAGGGPHLDLTTGVQLRGTGIAVLYMSNWRIDGVDRQDFEQVGSGKALYFIDGKVIEGSWARASLAASTHYLDASGQHVRFNPGGTVWIQVVPGDATVTYG